MNKRLYEEIQKLEEPTIIVYFGDHLPSLTTSSGEDIIENLELSKDVPSSYLIDDEELKKAYLRGLFLACGSINDPKTSRYHLEFFVNEYDEASFVSGLLNEFNLNSKFLKKDKKYPPVLTGGYFVIHLWIDAACGTAGVSYRSGF